MRTYLFFLLFLPMPFLSFFRPWIGMLLWGWLALLNPHRDLWGFASTLPYNMIIAIATITGWLLSSERKAIRLDITSGLILALFSVATLSAFFSQSPALTWPKWNEFGKTIIYITLLSMFLTTKRRLHALTWLIVGCIGFFGVKGGALFIVSGGNHHFTGPPGSHIEDRNELALAIVMVLPLMNYLRSQSAHWWVRRGLLAAMGFSVLAIIGTQSRGGFIALAVTGGLLWLRSTRKLATMGILLPIALSVHYLAPEAWLNRMSTIETAQEDQSFQGRLVAWQTYWAAALDRPLTGVGIRALNDTSVFFRYMPYDTGVETELKGAKAAHSIYFQVLGDVGFSGFVLYAALISVTLFHLNVTIWQSRNAPDDEWAGELARMLQVSIAGFLVGGAALSMAYYDLFFMLVIISSSLIVFHKDLRCRNARAPTHTDIESDASRARSALSHSTIRNSLLA